MLGVYTGTANYYKSVANINKTFKVGQYENFEDDNSFDITKDKPFVFMQKIFNNSIARENEIYFNRTKKRLSEEQLSVLDNLEYAINNTNILMSFYDDQIKTIFDLNNNRFFVNFIFGENKACVGLIKNNEYSFQEVELNKLNKFIKNT